MNQIVVVILSFLLSCNVIHSLYSTDDDVIELDPTKFEKMKTSDSLWLVEFYAPWCGHCKNLAPEWKKAATALKGIAKVGAVDLDKYSAIGQPYNVQGFPTIKIFGDNKDSPNDYNGGRDANSIITIALQQLNSIVSARMGKSGGEGYSSDEQKRKSSGSDVIDLTDSNFDQIYDSNDMWLVEFYAPWCGHCKSLKPHWEKAASELKGKVKLAAVDSTVNQQTAQRFGVQGYPTIKYFPAGPKSKTPDEYDGGRTSEDIVSWSLNKYVDNLPSPDVDELISNDVLKSKCENSQLCIIGFLPHLLDCQSKCRQKYIDILKESSEKLKRNKWSWLWVEGNAYLELEKSLEIGGFGYPAMVALNYKKGMYSLLKGSFSEVGIREYLRDLSYGKGSTAPLRSPSLPELTKRQPWDGKDMVADDEEEIDLSELGIETNKDEL